MKARVRADAEPRVAILDDHVLLAETLELALRSEGCLAERVPLPEPATPPGPLLPQILQMRPDVLLLDLDLGPWGDGYPLIEPATRAGTDVVVLTGIDEPAQWARAVTCGARRVVSKTEPLGVVLDTVRRLKEGLPVMTAEEHAELLAAWVRRRAGHEAEWARFDELSIRESEVLGLLMRGQSVQSIARHGNTAETTVRTQVKAVLGKLGVSSQLAAVGLAHRIGWRAPHHRDGLGA